MPPKILEREIDTFAPHRRIVKNPLPYPYGNAKPIDSLFDNVNTAALTAALDNAFDAEEEKVKRTRAVVVLYKDHLIAEKYAPGFSEETKVQGWSMTKSITGTILGILEKQGRISVSQNNLFPEWKRDDRAAITLDNLLRMNSALEWEEDYTKISDVTKMLFLAKDVSQVQLEKPLVGEPGSIWNYSSGTSNLLSGYIRSKFKTHQEYLDFWYSALIDKIGMHSIAGNRRSRQLRGLFLFLGHCPGLGKI